MSGNTNVRKSKYTYTNRFVIRETLANYNYPDDVILFMLKETKINDNIFSLLKYYQKDALSFMQQKTSKLSLYHVYNEIYNIYLFHNDIKGLFKRGKMDRIRQFEVRRILLLSEYMFVRRYVNKEEIIEYKSADQMLMDGEVRINNVHLLHELSEKALTRIKNDIMSYKKTLTIKDTNNTLYYYFENQIIGMLREAWDRTLFEIFHKIFNEYCASKHDRNKDCIRYFRRKLYFIIDTAYLKKINYEDLKYINEHLIYKRKHVKIFVMKGLDALETLQYHYKYRKTDVLIYFAERKYDKKIFDLIYELKINNEIIDKVKNAQENKGNIMFSNKSIGINIVNKNLNRKKRDREFYVFYC